MRDSNIFNHSVVRPSGDCERLDPFEEIQVQLPSYRQKLWLGVQKILSMTLNCSQVRFCRRLDVLLSCASEVPLAYEGLPHGLTPAWNSSEEGLPQGRALTGIFGE